MAQPVAARASYLNLSGLLPRLSGSNLVLVGTVAIVAYLVVLPLLFLFWSSFRSALPVPADPGHYTMKNYTYAYSQASTYTLFLNTGSLIAGSMLVAIPLAFSFAWLIERTDIPVKGLLFVLVLVSSAAPSMLLGMAYILLAGPEMGLLNLAIHKFFGVKPLNIFSLPALFILQGLHSVPTTFLILLGALRSLDPAMEEASTICGATKLDTARRVTFPMMLPAVLAATIYTGMTIAETFELPTLIGVPLGFYVFSSQVYLSVRVWGNFPLASTYSMLFFVLIAGLVYLYQRVTKHTYRFATISGKGYRPKVMELGFWKYPSLCLFAVFFAVTAVLPFFVFLWGSLLPIDQTPSLEMLFHLTLDSFRELFSSSAFLLSLKNTAILMITTPLAAIVLVSVASWIIVRSDFSRKAKGLLDALTFWPHAYPGIVLGVALLWFFVIVDFPPVWGTIWVIVLALVITYMPFTTRTLNAAFIQIHKDLEDAAHAAGASWLTTFRSVILPLALPAIAASAAWIGIHSIRALTAPMMLETAENQVVAVILWSYWESADFGAACAIGVMYFVVTAALALAWRQVGFRALR